MRKLLLFLLLPSFTWAIELTGKVTQGGLITAKVKAGAEVTLDDKPLKVSPTGIVVFGFGRDERGERWLRWREPGGQWQQRRLVITEREYRIQRIDGLPQKMVTPDPDVLTRIRDDNAQVAQARKTVSQHTFFAEGFIWAAEGPISGVYGSQRVLNGKPSRPHFGVDVAGPVGTPIVAPADGVVTLWHPDMYYSGGTMIIDHGMGVSSTFLHLSDSHVKVGERVKQGQHIADMGKTGRATGSHLDWRINWFSVRLDPALLVPQR